MTFEQLPAWAKKSEVESVFSGLCEGCGNRHICDKYATEWKADCKERAREIAELVGENVGYAIISDRRGDERCERLDYIDEEDEVIQE